MRTLTVVLMICITMSPLLAEAATGSAAVDTWYVRPVGACVNNGDGLAYGCAASAGATGAFIGRGNPIWTATTGIDDGDTLYVCGEHTGGDVLFSSGAAAGTAAAPIIINFDCPDDAGIIKQVTTMTEALTPANWTNESGSLWYLSVASYSWKDPRRIWLNDVELFPSNSKANLGARVNSATAPIGIFWYDSGNARIYLYSATNPSTDLTSFQSLVAAGAGTYNAMRIPSDSADYITIINPRLEGGQLASLYILGGDNITVLGTNADDSTCNIGKNGVRGIFVSDANGNGTGNLSLDVTIQDCTIDPVVPDQYRGSAWEYNWGFGDGISVSFGTTRTRVISNTINGWPHSNYLIQAISGTTSVTDGYVAENTFTCTRNTAYCRGFGIDGAAAGRATNNWVVRNTFTGFPNRSQFNGDANYLVANIFRDMRPDTVYSNRNEMLLFQPYGGYSDGNTVANNTFENNAYAPCIGWMSDPGGTVQNHRIVNNILHNCGGPYRTGHVDAAINLPVNDLIGTDVGDQIIESNVIYNDSRPAVIYYKGVGLTTVAEFQAACSGDTCTGNLEIDPQFVSSTDFRLSGASPLRRAGVWWGNECVDVRGRPCFVPPDIGAYQAGSGDFAPGRKAR